MPANRSNHPQDQRRPTARAVLALALRRVCTLVLIGAISCTLGCGGCNSSEDEDEASQADEEKRKKKDLELTAIRPLLDPGLISEEEGPDGEDDQPRIVAKPGHWMVAAQSMKANYDDFVGETALGVLDESESPQLLEQTEFTLGSQRPVVLSKGRPKRIETEVFIPSDTTKDAQLNSVLRRRGSGGELASSAATIQRMPPHQYLLLVLAESPEEYSFLKVADTVRAPFEDDDTPYDLHYHVVLAGGAAKSVPVPENPLAMTSLAYVVWDGLDPEVLTTAQQEAVVDWLHWGGRLVVSGPDSLDALRSGFLAPYLPAEGGSARSLAAREVTALGRYWGGRTRGKTPDPPEAINPWPAVDLSLRDGAAPVVGTDGLMVERAAGRGNVLVTAFQLAQRELVAWKGFDGFLNGAILGRPRRVFSKGQYEGLNVRWADFKDRRLDAHLTTPLRLFARDAGLEANTTVSESQTAPNAFGFTGYETATKVDRPEGVAGWNGFSPVSEAARSVLREAAGVQVPGSSFVVFCLAAYLLVLVPLNWAVFYTMGRVEWAWIAAPVIAVVGTVVVVQQAQLDIGFVRSQNEVALLELFGGHDRGHLSRYSAFYTSLSTTYDLEYEDPRTLAVPFSSQAKGEARSRTVSDRVYEAVSEKTKQSELRGLTVASAATTMVHAEQIATLDGPIRLGKSSRGHTQLENRSQLKLRDAAIVEYTPGEGESPPSYRGCWLGDVKPSDSVLVNFKPVTLTKETLEAGGGPFANERNAAAELRDPEPFEIGPLLRQAYCFAGEEDPTYSRRKETRLVALVDGLLPGSSVSPRASQVRGTTVVVAHLQTGPAADLRPDLNSRQDIKIVDPYAE